MQSFPRFLHRAVEFICIELFILFSEFLTGLLPYLNTEIINVRNGQKHILELELAAQFFGSRILVTVKQITQLEIKAP